MNMAHVTTCCMFSNLYLHISPVSFGSELLCMPTPACSIEESEKQRQGETTSLTCFDCDLGSLLRLTPAEDSKTMSSRGDNIGRSSEFWPVVSHHTCITDVINQYKSYKS